MDYEIKQLHFDDGDISLQKVVDLQNAVYEGEYVFQVSRLRHWYKENPYGEVISFNAFYGEELVAHYACVPYKMNIAGRVADGLLDIDTVTHKDHRGKGLFKKLAKTTYDYAKTHGFEFVVGVANGNSFPGYMKYFPFTFVGQLEVKMGLGHNIKMDGDKTYSVYWNKDFLEWRLGCMGGNYKKKNEAIVGKYRLGSQTFMGYFPNDLLNSANFKKVRYCHLYTLYVGIGAKFNSCFMNMPKFIKHSPFNLIFLDLTDGKLPAITKDNVFFQLMDFDVA